MHGFRAYLSRRRKAAKQDLRNIRDHGRGAPLFAQPIWVDPFEITTGCEPTAWECGSKPTGVVCAGDWDMDRQALSSTPILEWCYQHWQHGVPWEQTGAYEWQMQRIESNGGKSEGCRTLRDVAARYERLDHLFSIARSRGQIPRSREFDRRRVRDSDGVVVHVSRHCEPLFGFWGCHRFAIARILGIRPLRAQLGMVHPEAVPEWRKRFGQPLPIEAARILSA